MASTSLWVKDYDCKGFTKEFSPVGEKFQLTLNGKRTTLDTLGGQIMTNAGGYYMSTIPNLSTELKAMIPTEVLCRTPRLVWDGTGDKADLIVVGERGLICGDVALGTVNSPGNNAFVMPPNTTGRFVYEPNDVALAYGLPFRNSYKWDLTANAGNLMFPIAINVQDALHKAEPDASFGTITDVLSNLGYITTGISLMAICNIWEAGNFTEQYRGAIFSYLNDAGGGGKATMEYCKRILRGETSYRFWIPHITVVQRFARQPNNDTYLPAPGRVFYPGDIGGPPLWTGAPEALVYGDPKGALSSLNSLPYQYLSTGPQLDFTGDQWAVEQQWSGFLDFDKDLYTHPLLPPP